MQTLQDTWKAMETLYNKGQVRAIGVCNCLPHHIEAIRATGKILPMVNQLELHAGYMQEAASAYCRAHQIQLQAWSPLGRTRIMEDETIIKMAEKYKVSPARFLLRFLIDCKIAVIPKASSAERMIQNLDLEGFSISEEDALFVRCLPQKGWSGEHPDLMRVPLQV